MGAYFYDAVGFPCEGCDRKGVSMRYGIMACEEYLVGGREVAKAFCFLSSRQPAGGTETSGSEFNYLDLPHHVLRNTARFRLR
eukprot:194955-Pelagomonas_calceolata.AAC.1